MTVFICFFVLLSMTCFNLHTYQFIVLKPDFYYNCDTNENSFLIGDVF